VIPPPKIEESTLRPLPPNPCVPTPCGPNSVCQVESNQAQCGCMANMIGVAPNCRPECVLGSDCPSSQACINNRCVDPCTGACAPNAECRVINHSPLCNCLTGYSGNGFDGCQPIPAVGTFLIFFSAVRLFRLLNLHIGNIFCALLLQMLILYGTAATQYYKLSFETSIILIF